MLPVLFLIVVVDLIGFGIIIPLLPFYGEFYGASPDQIGLLMAIYSLTQFISAPLMGRWSDKYGRRPVLLFSLAGAVLSYIAMGLADSLWILFVARAFGGFMAGNIATAFAYAADITTVENRAKGMGIVGAAFGIGFILGPAIGGILAGDDPATANYQLPSFAAAGLSALALVLAFALLKESLTAEIRARAAKIKRRGRFQALRQTLGRPVLGPLILLTFLSTFVFAGMEATFALWSERAFGWGPEQNGWLFAYVGLISAFIQGGLVGRISKRFGERRLIVAGAVGLAIGLGLIPASQSLPMLIAAMGILAIGFSLLTPALNSLISLSVGEHEQGSIMGATRAASTLARVFGPMWGGYLFAILGRDWPFLAGGAIMGLIALASIRWLRRVQHRA